MKMLRAILLYQEHGFTICVPLPDASNTDTRVKGNIPGTGNMGDFPSTPPSSVVVFNSVQAPGEFEIWFPPVSFHTFTPAYFKKNMTTGPYLRTRAVVLKWIQVMISTGWSINLQKHQTIISTAVL